MSLMLPVFPISRHNALRMERAQQVLPEHGIISAFAAFTPVLAGTIPLGIDAATSDLDVLCKVCDHTFFGALSHEVFSPYRDFSLYSTAVNGQATTICNFVCADFPIEIFGQDLPVEQQYAYKHMVVDARLLDCADARAEEAIHAMKSEAVPTEVAFGVYVALEGDPYQAVLQLDGAPDELVL